MWVPWTLLLFVVLGKLFRPLRLGFLICKVQNSLMLSCCLTQPSLELSVILLPWASAPIIGVLDHSWFVLIQTLKLANKIVGFIMAFLCSCVRKLCSISYPHPHKKIILIFKGGFEE